jgi:hypothetical protein
LEKGVPDGAPFFICEALGGIGLGRVECFLLKEPNTIVLIELTSGSKQLGTNTNWVLKVG